MASGLKLRGLSSISGLKGLPPRVGGDTREVKLLLNGDTDWRQQDIDALNAFFPSIRALAPASGGIFVTPSMGPDLNRALRGILYTNQTPSLVTLTNNGFVEGDYSEASGLTGDGSSYLTQATITKVSLGVTTSEFIMCARVSGAENAGVRQAFVEFGNDADYVQLALGLDIWGKAFRAVGVTIIPSDASLATFVAAGRDGGNEVVQKNLTRATTTRTADTPVAGSLHLMARTGGTFAATKTLHSAIAGKVAMTVANMTTIKTAMDTLQAARAA